MRRKQLISSATLILQNLVQNCQEQEGFQEKKESTYFFSQFTSLCWLGQLVRVKSGCLSRAQRCFSQKFVLIWLETGQFQN